MTDHRTSNSDEVGEGAGKTLGAEGHLANLMLAEHLHRTANAFALALGGLDCVDRRGRKPSKQVRALMRAEIAGLAEVNRLLIPPFASHPVDASDLVDAVCKAIARTRLSIGRIEIAYERSPVLVAADTAWLIAVVVAELIENSLKHAFDASGGRITVMLGEDGQGLVLTVSDDGSGVVGEKGGRGTAIVDAAVDELGGRIVRAPSTDGTFIEVEVPTTALTRGLRSMRRCGPTHWGSA